MVLLTIKSKSLEQGEEIIKLLLEKKFVFDITIQKHTNCFQLNKASEIIESNSAVLTCITKGLLFSQIYNLLKEKYGKNKPLIYSVPIVNMDWEQSRILIDKTIHI